MKTDTKRYDVTALGELLIDFTQNGTSPQGNPLYEANPGGAPCNVLAMLERLGRKTAFIGKVGKDIFGAQLKAALEEVGIASEGLCMDDEVHTTLAFVGKNADGDREFSFYRKPGADMMLRQAEVDRELAEGCRIFHFGTLSMTSEDVRQATKYAVELAEKAGALISFDPNIRQPLWDSMDTAREQVEYGMRHCHILKISDNELEWFAGSSDYGEAAERLARQYDIPLVLVSLGKEGSMAFCGGVRAFSPAYLREDTVDTTGAGDTFMGCMLHQLLDTGVSELTGETLEGMLRFANGAASLITARKGALRVMPKLPEIEALLRQEKHRI